MTRRQCEEQSHEEQSHEEQSQEEQGSDVQARAARWAALLCIALLLGSPASASYRAFFSADTALADLPEGVSQVALYVESSASPSTAGTRCVNGNGGEICGWSVDIEATGGLDFVTFAPADPAGTLYNLAPKRLRANGGFGGEGRHGAIHIGDVTLERSGDGMLRAFRGGDAPAGGVIAADGGLESLLVATTLVPEPGLAGLWLAGLTTLGALIARRRQRAGRPGAAPRDLRMTCHSEWAALRPLGPLSSRAGKRI